MRTFFLFGCAHLTVIATLLNSLPSFAQLKVAPYHDKVLGYCAICHSTDYITMNAGFLDAQGWGSVVNKMVKVYGAPVPDAEIPLLVQYLTSNYGKTSALNIPSNK